jgi:hypothetical protein
MVEAAYFQRHVGFDNLGNVGHLGVSELEEIHPMGVRGEPMLTRMSLSFSAREPGCREAA